MLKKIIRRGNFEEFLHCDIAEPGGPFLSHFILFSFELEIFWVAAAILPSSSSLLLVCSFFISFAWARRKMCFETTDDENISVRSFVGECYAF